MHTDDAALFIIEYLRNSRHTGHDTYYGYELYLPILICDHLSEVEESPTDLGRISDNPRAKKLSPHFYDAAWGLCRRGVLRPSVRRVGAQGTATGDGYSLTTFGRRWIGQEANALFLEPGRLGELFEKLSDRLGPGFLQRANEAAACHKFSAYLGCCAMCGAATESILLSVAIAKSGDEGTILKRYRAANGRRNVTDYIVGKARGALADPFRSATGLLSYWRDDAAHGLRSTISEIEAHEALARLLRFAQFVADNWQEFTAPQG